MNSANSANSPSLSEVESFSNMGRFTPVITSIFHSSRKERLIFEGVPPNISVRMRIPFPLSTLRMASEIFSLISSTSSVGFMETASNCSSFPRINSATARNSSPNFKWVTITIPTICLLLTLSDVPMSRSQDDILSFETLE